MHLVPYSLHKRSRRDGFADRQQQRRHQTKFGIGSEAWNAIFSAMLIFLRNCELPQFTYSSRQYIPYLNGNGRVGRMLIASSCDQCEVLSDPLLYIRVPFKEGQADDCQYLESVGTEGCRQNWFDLFFTGEEVVVDKAAVSAQKLHQRMSEGRQRLIAHNGVTVSTIQLFEQLPNRPVVCVIFFSASSLLERFNLVVYRRGVILTKYSGLYNKAIIRFWMPERYSQ